MTYTNDPIMPPWYVPGWSTQLASYPENVPGTNVYPPFPDALQHRTITMDFFSSDSSPRSGYMTFEPSIKTIVYDNGDDDPTSITSSTQKVYLRRGHLSIDLLACDNSNTTPSSFYYIAKEKWLGGRTYNIFVPRTYDESPDDLNLYGLILPEGQLPPDPNNPIITEGEEFVYQMHVDDLSLDFSGPDAFASFVVRADANHANYTMLSLQGVYVPETRFWVFTADEAAVTTLFSTYAAITTAFGSPPSSMHFTITAYDDLTLPEPHTMVKGGTVSLIHTS